MKKILIAAITVSCIASHGKGAVIGQVVAGNLPASQDDTHAWEEVGLILPSYNNYNNVSKGQSFVASFNGLLTTIDSLIGAGFSAPVANSPPLRVNVYAANNGIPGSLLGTRQFQASSFHLATSSDIRETIDFTSLAIPLVQGQQYLVAFETPYGVVANRFATEGPYFIGYPNTLMGLTASQARNGIDWEVFSGNRELAIEVRAVQIPEPQSLVLVGGALAVLMRRRRSVPHNRV